MREVEVSAIKTVAYVLTVVSTRKLLGLRSSKLPLRKQDQVEVAHIQAVSGLFADNRWPEYGQVDNVKARQVTKTPKTRQEMRIKNNAFKDESQVQQVVVFQLCWLKLRSDMSQARRGSRGLCLF
jgi:hypothetical protein